MATLYYEGKIPMFPELDKIDFHSNDDDVCCFKVPKIYYEKLCESCEEEPVYDWCMDFLVMVNNQHVIKYIESTGIEVLLKNKYGESEWVKGKIAEILGIDVDGREDVRKTTEYIVEMYDLEKGEKKRGKVVFEETTHMSEYEIDELKQYYPNNRSIVWDHSIEQSKKV
jgi:hypothetical protein